MGSDTTDLGLVLVAQENALIGSVLVGVHARDPACVAVCSVNGKSAIDITPSLVELNSLPGVLGSLADASRVNHVGLILGVALSILLVDVALDLILAESKGQVELEGMVVVLARLGLLKARLVRVCCVSRAALSRATRILGSMVVRGTIGGSSGRGGEEASLGSRLVGGLVHFGLDLGAWLSHGVSQLHDQVIIKVILVG